MIQEQLQRDASRFFMAKSSEDKMMILLTYL